MFPQPRYGIAGHGLDVPVCPQSGMARRQSRGICSGLLRGKGVTAGSGGPAVRVCPGPAESSSLPR
jgi:hypothetical protein